MQMLSNSLATWKRIGQSRYREAKRAKIQAAFWVGFGCYAVAGALLRAAR